MDLWIRTQDRKKLINVFQIEVDSWKCSNNKEIIISDGNDNDLGTYKTKERALEVLDDIQSCIETNDLFQMYSHMGNFPNDFNKKYNYVSVFQMPKE